MENSCRSYFHSDCTHRKITLCTKHQQIVQKESYDEEGHALNSQYLNSRETIVETFEEDRNSNQEILLKFLEEENLFLKRERLKWINSSSPTIQDLSNKLKESEKNYADILQELQEANLKLQQFNDLESEVINIRKEHAQLLDSYSQLQDKNAHSYEENYYELLQEAKRKLEKTKDLESEICEMKKAHKQLLDSYNKLQSRLHNKEEYLSEKEKTSYKHQCSKNTSNNSLLTQLESRVAQLERETITHRQMGYSIGPEMSQTMNYIKQQSPTTNLKNYEKNNKGSLKALGNEKSFLLPEKSPIKKKSYNTKNKSSLGYKNSPLGKHRNSTSDMELAWRESPNMNHKNITRKDRNPKRRDESSNGHSKTPARYRENISVDLTNLYKPRELEDVKTDARKLSHFDKNHFCSTCFFGHKHYWVRPNC